MVKHTGGAGRDAGAARPLVACADRRPACRVRARADRTPRIRFSSCILQARPASRRACCTRPAAIGVFVSYTHECVFDLRDDDVYWCTADVGWVTGHSYSCMVHSPTARRPLMFEGVPNYPDFGRFWQVVDKHKVTLFYTAPTAIRALMREGEEPVKKASRRSCGCSARSANRSIRKPGSGIGASSATAAARSSTPGGRPRPAAF